MGFLNYVVSDGNENEMLLWGQEINSDQHALELKQTLEHINEMNHLTDGIPTPPVSNEVHHYHYVPSPSSGTQINGGVVVAAIVTIVMIALYIVSM